MQFIIVTGLSGAGKTRAIHIFEDIGFYCVDNIPPQLIMTFYDLCQKSKDVTNKKVAVVVDVRADNFLENLSLVIDKLKAENKKFEILFLDSSDDILIKRFRETRRKHPLSESYLGSISKSIEFERNILMPIKTVSNYIIDTSFLSPAQLKEKISSLFLKMSSNALMISCMSFGFKYGIPREADLIFDVRCLKNPFYIDELKNLTGLDEKVRDYVLKWDETKGFIERLFSLIDYMIPLYFNEGKSQLVIAIGCTGGKHRSVTLSSLLYNHLLENKFRVCIDHRDIKR